MLSIKLNDEINNQFLSCFDN